MAWVDAFAEDVSSLQEKLDVLNHATTQLKDHAANLAATDDDKELDSAHAKLQDVVDRLSLEGFDGLQRWTADAHTRALAALRDRLAQHNRWRGGRDVCRTEADAPLGAR